MTFYGVYLPLTTFFEYLAKAKLGENATLLDLFLVSQEMKREEYQQSKQKLLFEASPLVCLCKALLTDADKPEGIPIFERTPLRLYYANKSNLVMIGIYLATECMLTGRLVNFIDEQLAKHNLDGKNAKAYTL